MTTKRTKPRRRAPSTSLAVRPKPKAVVVARTRLARLVPPTDLNTLGEEATLGALGLVEIKLTALEEAILAEPVLIDAVEVKPTGQPYLSHPGYTRWFNRAFGRLGWAIVPRSKPLRDGKSVVCPYVLYIHGQPAAFAMGEQEYFEANKEQTYGDALEATVASALRRCAKRLGVGLELWDRAWLATFLEERCLKVWVESDNKPRFRLRGSRPFWNEKGPSGSAAARKTHEGAHMDGDRNETIAHNSPSGAPAAGHDGTSDQCISVGYKDAQGKYHAGQKERLWVIVRNSGRAEAEVRGFLLDVYGITSTSKILRRDYDAICKAIEGKGALPVKQAPRSREPGQEG